MSKPVEKDETLYYQPRSYGKTTKQLAEFYQHSMKGESIVLLTTKGPICSPEYLKRAIESESNKQVKQADEAWFQFMIDEIGYENARAYYDIIQFNRKELKNE